MAQTNGSADLVRRFHAWAAVNRVVFATVGDICLQIDPAPDFKKTLLVKTKGTARRPLASVPAGGLPAGHTCDVKGAAASTGAR
jgi:ADP-ribose pyrophosphatase YjhB (NUDIX family)